jgi:hypothetical protein
MDVRKRGLWQAVGVALYCAFVGLLFWKGNALFPHMNAYLGPVFILLVFSTSALICGLIVFYKPYKLFFEGKKKEAISTVLFTAGFLFAILVLLFGTLLLFR